MKWRKTENCFSCKIWLLLPSHAARFSRFTLNFATAAAESTFTVADDSIVRLLDAALFVVVARAPAALADRPGGAVAVVADSAFLQNSKTERNVRHKIPPHRIEEKHTSHDVPMCPSGQRHSSTSRGCSWPLPVGTAVSMMTLLKLV